MERACSKCGLNFPYTKDYFPTYKGKVFGGRCKGCRSKQSLEFYNRNYESVVVKRRVYASNNKELVKQKCRIYNIRYKKRKDRWVIENREHVNKLQRNRYDKSKDMLSDSYLSRIRKIDKNFTDIIEVARLISISKRIMRATDF